MATKNTASCFELSFCWKNFLHRAGGGERREKRRERSAGWTARGPAKRRLGQTPWLGAALLLGKPPCREARGSAACAARFRRNTPLCRKRWRPPAARTTSCRGAGAPTQGGATRGCRGKGLPKDAPQHGLACSRTHRRHNQGRFRAGRRTAVALHDIQMCLSRQAQRVSHTHLAARCLDVNRGLTKYETNAGRHEGSHGVVGVGLSHRVLVVDRRQRVEHLVGCRPSVRAGLRSRGARGMDGSGGGTCLGKNANKQQQQ